MTDVTGHLIKKKKKFKPKGSKKMHVILPEVLKLRIIKSLKIFHYLQYPFLKRSVVLRNRFSVTQKSELWDHVTAVTVHTSHIRTRTYSLSTESLLHLTAQYFRSYQQRERSKCCPLVMSPVDSSTTCLCCLGIGNK